LPSGGEGEEEGRVALVRLFRLSLFKSCNPRSVPCVRRPSIPLFLLREMGNSTRRTSMIQGGGSQFVSSPLFSSLQMTTPPPLSHVLHPQH
jgi:hypothetical protein